MLHSLETAARLTPAALDGLVRNETISVRWIGMSETLWYRRDTKQGHEFLLVDVETLEAKPAFDHRRVAQALMAATSSYVSENELPVRDIEFGEDLAVTRLTTPDHRILVSGGQFRVAQRDDGDSEPGLSPDAGKALFVRECNLWVRDLVSAREQQLTTDGEPGFAYATMPQSSYAGLLIQLGRRLDRLTGVSWAPGSKRALVTQVDERNIENYPFVRFTPGDGRPKVHHVRKALALEDVLPKISLHLVDVETGAVVKVKLPSGLRLKYAATTIWWSPDSAFAHCILLAPDARRLALARIDAANGAITILIEDSGPAPLVAGSLAAHVPSIRFVQNGTRVIFYSERSGRGHLYLHDASDGACLNAITSGDWQVHDIVHVDEVSEWVYFTAGEREPDTDPYLRHVYRSTFDGGTIERLTCGNYDHEVAIAPEPGAAAIFDPAPVNQVFSQNGRHFICTRSTLSEPPQHEVRRCEDGSLAIALERADAGPLHDAGFRVPEAVVLKSADGEHDLYGVIHWPPHAAPDRRCPLIDAIYAGPQLTVVPHNFSAHRRSNPPAPQALAELGFAVLVLDGRPTPLRSRAFRTHPDGPFGGLEDHVAAIGQLLKRYDNLDPDRIGVYGFSFGGYFAARAMVRYPELFKVGVAIAGSHNFHAFYPMYDFAGLPSADPSGMDRIPHPYRLLDNATFAGDLKGRLLLIAGELDENAPPALTFQFAEALMRAGKLFDFLLVPSATHADLAADPYVLRRVWTYFLEHLAEGMKK